MLRRKGGLKCWQTHRKRCTRNLGQLKVAARRFVDTVWGMTGGGPDGVCYEEGYQDSSGMIGVGCLVDGRDQGWG